jgi:hypothetical protein
MSADAYSIVFLDCPGYRLYAELIQMTEARRSCWLRPLALCMTDSQGRISEVLDIQNKSDEALSTPDIICSSALLNWALDIHWLEILETMQAPGLTEEDTAHQHLLNFLTQLQGTLKQSGV